MKITKSQLKQIIKEELSAVLKEQKGKHKDGLHRDRENGKMYFYQTIVSNSNSIAVRKAKLGFYRAMRILYKKGILETPDVRYRMDQNYTLFNKDTSEFAFRTEVPEQALKKAELIADDGELLNWAQKEVHQELFMKYRKSGVKLPTILDVYGAASESSVKELITEPGYLLAIRKFGGLSNTSSNREKFINFIDDYIKKISKKYPMPAPPPETFVDKLGKKFSKAGRDIQNLFKEELEGVLEEMDIQGYADLKNMTVDQVKARARFMGISVEELIKRALQPARKKSSTGLAGGKPLKDV